MWFRKKRLMTEEQKAFGLKLIFRSRYGLCPEPTTAQEAVEVLYSYLGEDPDMPLSTMPISVDQANTLVVLDILFKHSRQFRKDMRRLKKETKTEREELDEITRKK